MLFPKTRIVIRPLFAQKRLMFMAFLGMIITAISFGAGIGTLLPIMKLLLQDGQSLRALLLDASENPKWPHFLQQLVGSVAQIVSTDRFTAFVQVMGFVVVMTVFSSFGRILHMMYAENAVMRVNISWRKRLFDDLCMARMESLWKHSNSDMIQRIVGDTQAACQGVNVLLGKATEGAIKASVGVLMAFLIDWRFTLLALIALPFMAYVTKQFGKTIRKAFKKSSQANGEALAIMNEVITNMHSLKAAQAEGQLRRRFRPLCKKLFVQYMRSRRARVLSTTINEMLMLISMAVIGCVAAYMIIRQEFEPTRFIAVMGALGLAASRLKPLTNVGHTLMTSEAASERILELEVLMVPENLRYHTRKHLPRLPRLQQQITIENLSYTYPKQETPALKNFQVEIPHGQFVAIVGGNGSGKSTFVSLLERFMDPNEGRILFDGIDIAGVDLYAYRRQFAQVSQKNALLDGTIAQNISLGKSDASRQEIEEAAKLAYAHDFIASLPDGYDTVLGHGGSGLSGGQGQRICIARALLRSPSVLIMDEATSMIDPESEREIANGMKEIVKGRTTFAIAHRLSTVQHADRILVFEHGQLVGDGTHDALLSDNRAYQQIVGATLTEN